MKFKPLIRVPRETLNKDELEVIGRAELFLRSAIEYRRLARKAIVDDKVEYTDRAIRRPIGTATRFGHSTIRDYSSKSLSFYSSAAADFSRVKNILAELEGVTNNPKVLKDLKRGSHLAYKLEQRMMDKSEGCVELKVVPGYL